MVLTNKQKFNKKFGQDKDKSNSKTNMIKLTGIPRIYAFIMKAYDAKAKGKDKINQDQDLFDKIKNKLK